MATNEENWISDIVHDFIHSSIWLSPIQIFIDTNCACFDYDDEIEPTSELVNEQKTIYKKYQNLVHSLISSLSEDLKLDLNQLEKLYQTNDFIVNDESSEQLYSINDFNIFNDMMKRRNLILQLQALVNLQLECGLLKQTQTNDDQVLQLLLQATSTIPSKKSSSVDVKHKNEKERKTSIESVPEEILREKLRELTISSDEQGGNATTFASRQNFLKQQRDLIINKQRQQREKELEKETINARPQSAANVARQAIDLTKKQDEHIPNDELEKRRAMAAKIRREVVDKR